MKILTVLGARPQFIKAAIISKEIRKNNKEVIVHTGQHYDYLMSKIFFKELCLPQPDYNLGVGSGTHGYQTAKIIEKMERVLKIERPACVLVYGDTNSTLGAALAASKLCVPVVHIEAGLRSYNKKMPEEINRILTDHMSSILFCPTETAAANLKKEGFKNIINNGKLISQIKLDILKYKRIDFPVVINIGDVMYDIFLHYSKHEGKTPGIIRKMRLAPKSYYLVTVHRSENTNNVKNLNNILIALNRIKKTVIFPLHPRTKESLIKHNILIKNNVLVIAPVSYLDMLSLEKNAMKILTDSGGIQKEAYFLGVPCITLREETEWIETLEGCWNTLAGVSPDRILDCIYKKVRLSKRRNYHGDGFAYKRIVNFIKNILLLQI